ncbi:MAG: DUF1501 domain-containing protein [Planctomycetes bacterium]|nr:DUF1501 domain-containing protein [Planctomycetota bacterium]
MLSILGHSRAACDGLTRRELLRAAGAGLLGVTLPKVLAAEGAAPPRESRARSVIFLFLFGGPSQLESFDMKPEAPSSIRGPFRPIPSRTPGLLICEHLPRLARVSDKCCVVRTMTHGYNDHSGAGHYIQTGRRWQVPVGGGFNATPQDWPSMGSVVERLDQRTPGVRRDLPSYMVLPSSLGRLQETGWLRRPGEYAGWMGASYNPLTTTVSKRDANDNPYWRDCSDEELTFQFEGLAAPQEVRLDRLHGRLSLLEQLDAERRRFDDTKLFPELDRLRQRALNIVASEETRKALDLRREPDRIRDLYGRHLFGQSALLARRLVEAGVRFVTVHYDACDGYSWDSHVHSRDLKDYLLPTLDQALAALLEDLDARGLLDETLVVALGEMGRTPAPTPEWGRGHWSTLFPAVLAGAGIHGGTVHGESDRQAAYPKSHPTSPEDLAATVYHALGIDPELHIPDLQGRPVPLVEGGRALVELFG